MPAGFPDRTPPKKGETVRKTPSRPALALLWHLSAAGYRIPARAKPDDLRRALDRVARTARRFQTVATAHANGTRTAAHWDDARDTCADCWRYLFRVLGRTHPPLDFSGFDVQVVDNAGDPWLCLSRL
jgi:hypothetical protein